MVYISNQQLSTTPIDFINGVSLGTTGWKLLEVTNYTMVQNDRLVLRDDANGVEFLTTTAYQDIPANSPVDIKQFVFYWTEQPYLNTIEIALENNSGTSSVEVTIKDAELNIT